MEIDLLLKGREPRDKGTKGKVDIQRVKMCYVYAPTPHNECKYYVLHTLLIKIKIKKELNLQEQKNSVITRQNGQQLISHIVNNTKISHIYQLYAISEKEE